MSRRTTGETTFPGQPKVKDVWLSQIASPHCSSRGRVGKAPAEDMLDVHEGAPPDGAVTHMGNARQASLSDTACCLSELVRMCMCRCKQPGFLLVTKTNRETDCGLLCRSGKSIANEPSITSIPATESTLSMDMPAGTSSIGSTSESSAPVPTMPSSCGTCSFGPAGNS